MDRSHLVSALIEAAEAAGAAILEAAKKPLGAERKADYSPVTLADRAADAAIREILARRAPGLPIVSEEEDASHAAKQPGAYVLVDPLDGTRGFIEGRDDYAVLIALMEAERPTLGVIYAPVRDDLTWTAAEGGAMRRFEGRASPIRTRAPSAAGYEVLVSRTSYEKLTQDFLKAYSVAHLRRSSSALKFCEVARGEADLYPRFGPTYEWDTAAGEAILVAAGGRVTTPEGAPLPYGKPGRLNSAFVAWGR